VMVSWILGGILIVGSAWRWMIRRIERREQERYRARQAERARRWRNLR